MKFRLHADLGGNFPDEGEFYRILTAVNLGLTNSTRRKVFLVPEFTILLTDKTDVALHSVGIHLVLLIKTSDDQQTVQTRLSNCCDTNHPSIITAQNINQIEEKLTDTLWQLEC